MEKTEIFVVLLFIVINFVIVSSTKRPIIGILTQEIIAEQRNAVIPVNDVTPYKSHIAASYVKAVESSGARVVPVFVNQPESYYRWILKSINGVILPGGVPKIYPGDSYYDASTIIYKIATEMNKNETYFPILAICLGFETLATIANNHKPILKRCKIHHENYPLRLTPSSKESLLFSNIAADALIYLKYFPSTVNYHDWCVTPFNYTRSHLPKNWKVTSTSVSLRGLKFVTSIEHKQFPFFGLQFHPEKILFEWNDFYNVPHNDAAIIANRHFYDLLVRLSKLNYNKFESEEVERDSLIYNYKPVYMNDISPIFVQVYAFT